MRPDTRSFSFTWMKGQSQKTKLPHQKLDDDDESQQSTSSSSSQQCSNPPPPPTSSEDDKSDNWAVQRGNSGSRLRKLGNSLVRLRNGGRYSNMNNLEDENNWQKISEEVLSLEEDDEGEDEMRMEVQIQDKYQPPDVVTMTTGEGTNAKSDPVPFQPRENYNFNIGPGGGETSGMSLSKRLNKTVQGVKASLGNFSQVFKEEEINIEKYNK